MIYMNEEEIKDKMDAGDMEVINGVLAGEILPGEAPEGTVEEVQVEEAEVVVETVAEVPVEAPIEATEPVVDNSKAEYEALLSKYKEETKKSEVALKDAEAERVKAKEARELLESIKKQSAAEQGGVTYKSPSINEDDTDVDLAGSYSKNNRAMLDSLKESITGAASVDQIALLEQKLNTILELEEGRKKDTEALAAKDAEEERMNKLFSEVDAFSQGHEHFQMNRGTVEVFNDVNVFKTRLQDFLRTTDIREVEKAYRGAVSGKDESLIRNLESAGVVVPQDADPYLRLAEIVDLKNGYKFNEYTGEYEELKDDFGVRVSQRSIEDAYKLSRFTDIVAEARAEQTQEIERKLTSRDNSATTLPQDVSSDGSDDGKMTHANADAILNMPDSAFRNNPALKQQLDAILNM